MANSRGEKEIDSEGVRKHVDKLLKKMSFDPSNIEISSGATHGDNYVSLIAEICVNGKNAKGKSQTLNLIAKSAVTNEGARNIMHMETLFEREIFVYSKVFPSFEKLQLEQGISRPFKSYAKCYYTCAEFLNEVLIFENMKKLGYQLRDRKKTLDYEHVLLVMREYGRLHALSFALKDIRPEIFSILKCEVKFHPFEKFKNEDLKKFIEAYKREVLDSLYSIGDKNTVEKFNNFVEDSAKRIRNALGTDDYSIFIHGDCWVNNMLFKYENSLEPHRPTDVCFLDFQLSALGSPVIDLSYFLLTNTDNNLREHYYDLFLEQYYSSLSDSLKQFGCNPDKFYPLDVFQKHLRTCSVYGFYMSMMVIKLMLGDVDEIPDFRSCSNIDEAVKIMGYKSKQDDEYQKRVRDVVLFCEKRGYI